MQNKDCTMFGSIDCMCSVCQDMREMIKSMDRVDIQGLFEKSKDVRELFEIAEKAKNKTE